MCVQKKESQAQSYSDAMTTRHWTRWFPTGIVHYAVIQTERCPVLPTLIHEDDGWVKALDRKSFNEPVGIHLGL